MNDNDEEKTRAFLKECSRRAYEAIERREKDPEAQGKWAKEIAAIKTNGAEYLAGLEGGQRAAMMEERSCCGERRYR